MAPICYIPSLFPPSLPPPSLPPPSLLPLSLSPPGPQRCDEHENQIEHITHIPSRSDCQAICQNHEGCEFWSHAMDVSHPPPHQMCHRFYRDKCSLTICAAKPVAILQFAHCTMLSRQSGSGFHCYDYLTTPWTILGGGRTPQWPRKGL